MKDKLVIIKPFFSACKGGCPVMIDNLQKIQEYLGDKMVKTVNLISITVDYKTDQPYILKQYADAYKANQGGVLLLEKKRILNWHYKN
jgi:protein SCO1